MLIDLIVASALLLFGLYLVAWLRDPALRKRIESPKYGFMAQVQAHESRAEAVAPSSAEQHP